MKVLIAGLMLAIAVTAVASDRGWRVGGELIVPGDTMAKVQRVAGTPDVRNRVESKFGGTIGNRWYYVKEGYDDHTKIITFSGGRVVRIETRRE